MCSYKEFINKVKLNEYSYEDIKIYLHLNQPRYKRLPKKIRYDIELIKITIADERNYKYIPKKLKKDINLIIELVKINKRLFEKLNEKLKKIPEILLIGLIEDFDNIKYLDESIKNDENFVLSYIKFSHPTIKKEVISKDLLNSKEFVQKAIDLSPIIYNMLNDKLKSDKDI